MTAVLAHQTRHHQLGKQCHHAGAHRLTCDEYDLLWSRAGGRCEICRTTAENTPRGSLVIDHDHHTGRVRGLLCDRCNWFMGRADAYLLLPGLDSAVPCMVQGNRPASLRQWKPT